MLKKLVATFLAKWSENGLRNSEKISRNMDKNLVTFFLLDAFF